MDPTKKNLPSAQFTPSSNQSINDNQQVTGQPSQIQPNKPSNQENLVNAQSTSPINNSVPAQSPQPAANQPQVINSNIQYQADQPVSQPLAGQTIQPQSSLSSAVQTQSSQQQVNSIGTITSSGQSPIKMDANTTNAENFNKLQSSGINSQRPANAPVPTSNGQLPSPEIHNSFGPTSGDSNMAKKILFVAFGGLLAIGAVAAFAILVYLPNTPENVYRRGLASIGVGLKELVNNPNQPILPTTEYSGQLEFSQPVAFTANINGNFDQSGQGNFSFLAQYQDIDAGTNIRYLTDDGDSLPTLYVELNGIESVLNELYPQQPTQSLGLVAPPPQDSQGEINQLVAILQGWHVIDLEEIFQQLGASSQDIDDLSDQINQNNQQLSQQDVQTILLAAIEATNEFVFTADSDKMVLQIQEVLDKEEYEGVMSQKYLTTVNKNNLSNYLKKLRDNISNAIKEVDSPVLNDLELEVDLGVSDEDIEEAVEEINLENTSIEAWVSLDNKVLRNIRINDLDPEYEDGQYGYMDISMLAEDTNIIPLRMRIEVDDYLGKGYLETKLTVDIENSLTTFEMSSDLDIFDQGKIVFNMNLSAQATDNDITPEIPTDAKQIMQTLEELSLTNIYGWQRTTTNQGYFGSDAYDTELRTIINVQHAALEEFYNDNGFYPQTNIYQETAIATRNYAFESGLMTEYSPEAYQSAIDLDYIDPATEPSGFRYYPGECFNLQCQKYVIKGGLKESSYSINVYTKNSLN